MNRHERIPIVRKDGVTIYGRVIDNKGKMGNYEVFSDQFGTDAVVYASYADAEKRANSFWYAMAKNQKQK